MTDTLSGKLVSQELDAAQQSAKSAVDEDADRLLLAAHGTTPDDHVAKR